MWYAQGEEGRGWQATGPNGEKRPQSGVEAAVAVGRIAVGDRPKDSPRGPQRVLLEEWAAERSVQDAAEVERGQR